MELQKRISNPKPTNPSCIRVSVPEGRVAGIITPIKRMLINGKKCEGINSKRQVTAIARLPIKSCVPPL